VRDQRDPPHPGPGREPEEQALRAPGGQLNIVISGPGGVGKGTLVALLLDRDPKLWLSRSWTTRARRPGEAEDAYVFVDRAAFEQRIAAGGFVEWAEFLGNLYGTPVPEALPGGKDVVLEIEVQGARQVRAALPDTVQVFIAPPSADALRARLVGRGTDDAEQVDRRLATAERELEAQGEFTHVVVNDRLEDAVAELEEIVRATTGAG
jgi:guanylate kinase